MRVLDLFSGIGGFTLGMEMAGGFETVSFCEVDPFCREVLKKHWPGVPILEDVKQIKAGELREVEPVDLICGGDPCPSHSRARSNGSSRHPDLSGWFLSMAGRLCPRWVVRENVPAPTVDIFAAGLDALGYTTQVVRMDAAPYTGQQRIRDFVVGCADGRFRGLAMGAVETIRRHGGWSCPPRLGSRPVTPALTCHRTRYDSRDCYIWKQGEGLRILVSPERARLAGFPDYWLTELSPARIAKMYGNSVCPQVVCEIATAIRECDERLNTEC